jgi:hypothetical protein
MLTTLALGFTGIGVPWLSSSIYNLLVALLFTGAKKAKESDLVNKLKPKITRTKISAGASMKTISTKAISAKQLSLKAKGLDALRATKVLQWLGIHGATLEDSEDSTLVFSVTLFASCVGPLTEFYGKPQDISNPSWNIKKLVWAVPQVNGQVMLMQVAKMKPLLIFKQL